MGRDGLRIHPIQTESESALQRLQEILMPIRS
eukprot:UN11303